MNAPSGVRNISMRDGRGAAAADGAVLDGVRVSTAATLERPGPLDGVLLLPRAPWRARICRGTAGRPAMELYAAGTLLDVVVATDLADEVLCGARRAIWDGRPQAIAWGRLTVPAAGGPGHRDVAVLFARGRLGRRRDRRRNRGFPGAVPVADVVGLAGWFWVAIADGRFDTVTVMRRGQQATRRLVTVHPRPAP
jgi:hypothetical protein